MARKRKATKKKKSSRKRSSKRKRGTQIGSPQVFELYGGL